MFCFLGTLQNGSDIKKFWNDENLIKNKCQKVYWTDFTGVLKKPGAEPQFSAIYRCYVTIKFLYLNNQMELSNKIWVIRKFSSDTTSYIIFFWNMTTVKDFMLKNDF